MRKLIISAIFGTGLISLSALAQGAPKVPAGWTCKPGTFPDGTQYNLCSPPSGSTEPAVYYWTRAKKPQTPAK